MTETTGPAKRPRKTATSAKSPGTASATAEDVARESLAEETRADPTRPAPPPREAAVEALMRLAAEQPWSDIEIGDIAREAGLTLAELRDLFPSKGAVLGGLTRIIDRKVLEGRQRRPRGGADPRAPVRRADAAPRRHDPLQAGPAPDRLRAAG